MSSTDYLIFSNKITTVKKSNNLRINNQASLNYFPDFINDNMFITIELLLGLFYNVNDDSWSGKTFNSNDFWYSGLLTQDDKTKIESFGLNVITDNNQSAGLIGALEYNDDYIYSLSNFYSDIGVTKVTFDKTKFVLSKKEDTLYTNSLVINSSENFNTAIKSYKIKITKRKNNKFINISGYSDITYTTKKLLSGLVHKDITINAYFGDSVTIPDGYIVSHITSNVGYAFAKYASTTSDVILVFDTGYNDSLTSSILQNYPPTSYPCIEIFKGSSISQNVTPKMQGQILTRGRTTGVAPSFTLTEGSVNGTSQEYGDYFILMKGTTTSSTVRNAVMSSYPARFFLQIDTVGNVNTEAFFLPKSLWSFENGVFSWLGDTTSTNDLAYYYANDWDDPVYFNIHCVHK